MTGIKKYWIYWKKHLIIWRGIIFVCDIALIYAAPIFICCIGLYGCKFQVPSAKITPDLPCINLLAIVVIPVLLDLESFLSLNVESAYPNIIFDNNDKSSFAAKTLTFFPTAAPISCAVKKSCEFEWLHKNK